MSNLYRFGQFALDSRRRTLSRADSAIVLTPKAFDVLLFLVQSPNRLVTKEELLKAVWADTFVEEGNLTQYISHLRKALGDNPEDARLIVTIARKGYQFTGNVSVAEATAPPNRARSHSRPPKWCCLIRSLSEKFQQVSRLPKHPGSCGNQRSPLPRLALSWAEVIFRGDTF